MEKGTAKQNLKEVLNKYNKYKKSDALEHEANAEKIIEDIFEKVLDWESLEDYVKRKSQKTGKFPDYTFRLNGINKFFLEAKKINATLDNISFQKQAIGYARSSSVSFAVLTNFVELRVYVVDREIDNSKNFEKSQLFKPILIENCLNESEFEKLWLLSKESFINKRIYEFAEEICKLPKRKEIGKHLSEKLNYLREKIKSNIKKNDRQNHKILYDKDSKVLLDEVTQKILDRLVFVRVCEDREFENRYLESFLNYYKENKIDLWKSVKDLFKDYDKKNEKTNVGGYDSGLFETSLCDDVFLDENIIGSVIEEFYYFDDGTPIDFSKIPADVLGNLYENYLSYISKNIDIQKSHKKEQGIFYTPTYIVDYIVKNTLGELLKDKKVNIEKIKILDPACGSGSFLIKAFDVIEEYYRKDENYNQKTLADDGTTYSTKEKILKNNIFGVDLDAKAVEIAQLNLLLKIAEKGHRLPLLQQNIKRGNSLIDDENIIKTDAFKWDDRFSDIIQYDKNGSLKEGFGFNVIIGNPPYVDIKQLDPKIVRHFFDKYSTVENRMNLYAVFVERALSLLKDEGYFGFIIPNSILYNESYQKIRELLLDKVTLKKIIRLPDNVFQNVKVETIILIYQKKKEMTKKPNCEVLIYPREATINAINKENNVQVIDFNQKIWETENNVISISTNISLIKLLNKIEEETKPLIDICDFSLGLTPYDKYKGHTKSQIEERTFHSKTKKNSTFKPLLSGENIIRYSVFWDDKEYISYGDWLGAPREQRFFTKPRIVVRQIISGKPPRIYAGYTEEELYNTQIAFNILVKDDSKISMKYLLSILNSKLMNFYHKERYLDPSKNLFQKILIVNAKKFPIKVLPLEKQQPVIKLVDKMLLLNKKLNELGDKKTDERARIKEEIEETDTKIDEEIYRLYGITKEEQEVIEKS